MPSLFSTRVSGGPNDELRWLPVASDHSIEREVASERTVADRLPVLQCVVDRAKRKAPSGGAEESAIEDSALESELDNGHVVADCGLDLDDLAGGLTRLGVPAGRSRRLIAAAIEALPGTEIAEANVLRRAIASI